MENKKSLFDKIMDHSFDIAFLGIIGAWVTTTVSHAVNNSRANKYTIQERSNRIDNIKELQKNGAKVDINLEGDI